MRQGRRLGGPSEELLEAEIEADVAVIDGQPADRRAGQGPCRAGQAAIESGGLLGGERRIAGQQLVGAVAAERHGDLAACEPAQQVRRQDRRIAERLVEPAGDLGEQLVNRRRPRRSARDGRSPGAGPPRGRVGSRRSSGPRTRSRTSARSGPARSRTAPPRRSTSRPRLTGTRPAARRTGGAGPPPRRNSFQNRPRLAREAAPASAGARPPIASTGRPVAPCSQTRTWPRGSFLSPSQIEWGAGMYS